MNNAEAKSTWKEFEFKSFVEHNDNIKILKSSQTLCIVVYAKGGIETGIKFQANRVQDDTFIGTVEFKGNNPLYIKLMRDELTYVATNIDQVSFDDSKDDLYNVLKLEN